MSVRKDKKKKLNYKPIIHFTEFHSAYFTHYIFGIENFISTPLIFINNISFIVTKLCFIYFMHQRSFELTISTLLSYFKITSALILFSSVLKIKWKTVESKHIKLLHITHFHFKSISFLIKNFHHICFHSFCMIVRRTCYKYFLLLWFRNGAINPSICIAILFVFFTNYRLSLFSF